MLSAASLAKETFIGFLALGLFTGPSGSVLSLVRHISD
jgi:hypothetical protein